MKKKKEPGRVIIFVISILFIVFMWVKKDIADIYTTMPGEQIVPMIVTTIAVSLLKFALITGAILLLKWIMKKIQK